MVVQPRVIRNKKRMMIRNELNRLDRKFKKTNLEVIRLLKQMNKIIRAEKDLRERLKELKD